MEVLGIPPKEVLEKGCRSKKFFQDFHPKIRPNKKGKLRKPASKTLKDIIGTSNENFLDFLSRCFAWCP
jgi:dual specificity tyrosine-phosphorylation-regulated kinase 2/3/4